MRLGFKVALNNIEIKGERVGADVKLGSIEFEVNGDYTMGEMKGLYDLQKQFVQDLPEIICNIADAHVVLEDCDEVIAKHQADKRKAKLFELESAILNVLNTAHKK